MKNFSGQILFLDRSDINTDEIIPAKYLTELTKAALKPYCLEDLSLPGFDPKKDIAGKSVIITRANFGCGSSREQAPIALKQVGVALVIAKGFARIFRRNSINIGMPVWVADVADGLKTGDVIEADLEKGTVTVNGEVKQFNPLSENVRKTLEYGGLIPRVRAELGIEG